MSRNRASVPRTRSIRAGRGRVRTYDSTGKRIEIIQPGVCGSKESKDAYAKLLLQGKQEAKLFRPKSYDITVADLVLKFMDARRSLLCRFHRQSPLQATSWHSPPPFVRAKRLASKKKPNGKRRPGARFKGREVRIAPSGEHAGAKHGATGGESGGSSSQVSASYRSGAAAPATNGRGCSPPFGGRTKVIRPSFSPTNTSKTRLPLVFEPG